LQPDELPPQLEFFGEFCGRLKLEDGSPFALYPEQKVMLTDFFGGAEETLILIPKKNGKTTLLAALGLFHLIVTDDAACFIGAASKDQAAILYRQAHGFISRSKWLQQHVVVRGGSKELRSARDLGILRVLAADADTADGVIPTLALVDELHRHKNSDLYAVFRDGLGPRHGQMITISTAGDDEQSPLGRLREAAHKLDDQFKDGAYRYARKEGFALHEWALEPDDDRDDLDLVLTANPAPWVTEEILKGRKESPSMQSWEWARFACGVWIFGEESAISEKEWRACADPEAFIPDGTPGVVVGIDLGWKWDTTAIVPVLKDENEDSFVVHPPTIVVPPRDGTSTPMEDIWGPIEDMADKWPEVTFVLDPEAGGEQLAQRIDGELPNAVVATHSQKVSPMALAAQRLSDLIAECRITHPDDPEMTAQVLAAAAKPVGESFRFTKHRKRPKPIDSIIALAMAVSTLHEEPPKPSSVFIQGL
jgi:phage terminase large subunit-like protein